MTIVGEINRLNCHFRIGTRRGPAICPRDHLRQVTSVRYVFRTQPYPILCPGRTEQNTECVGSRGLPSGSRSHFSTPRSSRPYLFTGSYPGFIGRNKRTLPLAEISFLRYLDLASRYTNKCRMRVQENVPPLTPWNMVELMSQREMLMRLRKLSIPVASPSDGSHSM